MSEFEPAAETEAKQILASLDAVEKRLMQLTEAVNGLGSNVQWVIENAQGIFQMFANPAFMSMIPNMMGGMNDAGAEPAAAPAE